MRLATFIIALATVACAKTDTNRADSNVVQAGVAHDPAVVQRSIDSALVTFMAAAKRSDPAGMASVFAEDGMVLPPGMKASSGRPQIEKGYAAMFRVMGLPEITIKTTDLIVSGEYAIETGTYDQTMKPTNGTPVRDIGKYVSVWKRQPDGSWKMVRDIFNSDQ
jgi:uncharacterized protein (TIGR02246 family)